MEVFLIVLGAALALASGVVMDVWRGARARRVAARLVLLELAENEAMLEILGKEGVGAPHFMVQRSAWDALAAALVGHRFEVVRSVHAAYLGLRLLEVATLDHDGLGKTVSVVDIKRTIAECRDAREKLKPSARSLPQRVFRRLRPKPEKPSTDLPV